MANKSTYSFSTDAPQKEESLLEINKLWNLRSEGYLKGKNDKKVYWITITNPEHTKAVVVVNGRCESAWKYQELFYDLYINGYDVYSFDHRGQGRSERITTNPQMGHVNKFSDYVGDMAQLIEHFDLSRYNKNVLLAHSMGGAVSTRYLQSQKTHPFHAIAVSAPMYGVNMAWYLRPVSRLFSRTMAAFQKQPGYATSNREYYAKPFQINPLTQSKARYCRFRQLYEEMPQLKLGGPSYQWVWQSLKAANACIKNTDKIELPLLLLQASEDKIVNNASQNKFINKIKKTNANVHFEIISGAKHEILFEKDEYRNPALTKVLNFFDKF